MAARSSFYIVVFDSRDTGRTESSMTCTTVRVARKRAEMYRKFADNVRILKGGPGGMEVR